MPTGTAAKGTKVGQLESIGQPVVKVANNASNSRVFTAGDVLTYNSRTANKWDLATSGSVRPFAVCYKDKASTATRFAYVDDPGVYVTVTAGGAIKADALVKCDTATDGRVIAATEAGTDTTLTSHLAVVGQFIKIAKYVAEAGGVSRSDAAATDIVLIKLL